MASRSNETKSEKLIRIKKSIEGAKEWWMPNIQRYNSIRDFVFRSTLSDQDISNLGILQKPPLQFNLLEAYLSRQLGEYAQQEPTINITARPDSKPVDPRLIDFLQGYFLECLDEAKKCLTQYLSYKQSLSGGYSVLKVETDYESPASFQQKITLRHADDPTLIIFDPNARDVCKSDGSFCYEELPLSIEEFEDTWPDVDVSGLGFNDFEGFGWSYGSDKQRIVKVIRYFEKRKKKFRLFYLANGQAMTEKQYNQLLKYYEDNQIIAQPPTIVKKRWSTKNIIVQYHVIEDQILDETETDYSFFPYVFMDGNSAYLREGGPSGSLKQFTKSYLANAVDVQKLVNIAGQTWANELENLSNRQLMIPQEGLMQQYSKDYTNLQQLGTLVYKSYTPDGNPIAPPQQFPRQPLATDALNTFMGAQTMVQSVLGSYDAQLGINQNELSGIAIENAATQSNAAAMPFIVNNLAALSHAAQIIIDLIPKVHMLPTVLPTRDDQGARTLMPVNNYGNNPQSLALNYEPQTFSVNVEAGLNYEVQKNRSLHMLSELAQQFPAFAQMVNEKGLGLLVENLTLTKQQQWESIAEQFMQQMQQQQAQGQQHNPQMMAIQLKQQELQQKSQIEQAKLQQNMQKMQADIGIKQQQLHMDNQHKMADIGIDQQHVNIDKEKIKVDRENNLTDAMLHSQNLNHDRITHATEMGLEATKHQHQVHKDMMNHMENMADKALDIVKNLPQEDGSEKTIEIDNV